MAGGAMTTSVESIVANTPLQASGYADTATNHKQLNNTTMRTQHEQAEQEPALGGCQPTRKRTGSAYHIFTWE